MANQNDSFIDEVTDDLRRDRLFKAMRRYGWLAVLAIVLLVGAAAYREWTVLHQIKSAQAFGDAILAAETTEGGPEAKAAAISAIATKANGQIALRDILAADALAEAGKVSEAAQRYDSASVAAGASGDLVMRDLAALRSVMVEGQDMEPAARDAALTQLSVPGAPFELIALELKALALVNADRDEDAVTLIRQIQQKDGLSQAQRSRLAELMITLGVDPEPEAAADAAADPTRAAQVVPPEAKN